MASTISQIKSGLDEIAKKIANERLRLIGSKTSVTLAKTNLAAMPTQFGTLLADILALTGTDPSTVLAKDERLKLIAEYQALQVIATNAETAIAGIINL